jgi:hypothetical protein
MVELPTLIMPADAADAQRLATATRAQPAKARRFWDWLARPWPHVQRLLRRRWMPFTLPGGVLERRYCGRRFCLLIFWNEPRESTAYSLSHSERKDTHDALMRLLL